MKGTKQKILITAGITALLLVLRARRRMKQKKNNLCASAKRRAQLGQTSTLPFFVDPEVLTNGWAVAPAIYYPPSMAVVPFVQNNDFDDGSAEARSPKVNASSPVHKTSEGDLFIVCEEMAEVPAAERSTEDVLQAYLQANPLFGLGGAAPQLQPLLVQKTKELSEKNSKPPASVFTHIVVDEANNVLLLVGHQGRYVVTACMQNFSGRLENVAQLVSSPTHHHATPSASDKLHTLVQMVVDAVFAVAPTDQHRFPGTPAGACHGYYTVRCSLKDKEVQLSLPAAIKVCTGAQVPSADALLTLSCGDATVNLARSQVEDFAALSAGEEVALFPAVEGLPSAAPRAKLVSVKAALSGADEVTVTFNQPTMGIRFPVEVRSGIVYDPLLVGNAQVLYYPQGIAAAAAAAEPEHAKPLITFELLPALPPTWEAVMKSGDGDKTKTNSNNNNNNNNNNTDEVLLHNVKFHFTEWEREQTACTIVEQAGHTAVQFVETKEGITCRSLVLPRKDSILVIRCEVAANEWSSYTPFMQSFFDKLYIDNVK